MAELADALDLGSSVFDVQVQVLSPAPRLEPRHAFRVVEVLIFITHLITNIKIRGIFMNLDECILGRRSIREFTDKPVTKEDIETLIKAAQMAPSWKNSQVSRYYAVTTPEAREKLISRLSDFNKNNAKNAPVLIVSTVVNARSGFERDGSYTTHLKDGFQYFDNGLQIENLCLKAYDLGLSTLIMGIYDNEQIRSL